MSFYVAVGYTVSSEGLALVDGKPSTDHSDDFAYPSFVLGAFSTRQKAIEACQTYQTKALTDCVAALKRKEEPDLVPMVYADVEEMELDSTEFPVRVEMLDYCEDWA